jgi:hypothetical protein
VGRHSNNKQVQFSLRVIRIRKKKLNCSVQYLHPITSNELCYFFKNAHFKITFLNEKSLPWHWAQENIFTVHLYLHKHSDMYVREHNNTRTYYGFNDKCGVSYLTQNVFQLPTCCNVSFKVAYFSLMFINGPSLFFLFLNLIKDHITYIPRPVLTEKWLRYLTVFSTVNFSIQILATAMEFLNDIFPLIT